MAMKCIVLATALAMCQAGPIYVSDNGYIPGMIVRIGRSPNMAFGFGSGFSSNIGGISHSTSMGSSFQSGDAEAYGAGVAATNGGAFARGVGIANAAPAPFPGYQQSAASVYNGGMGRNNFGSALSSSQNYGGHFGSAVSSAQAQNGLQYGSAMSAVQNSGLRGLGYDSSVAAANSNSGLGFGSALSSAQTHNGFDGYGSAMSAAQNAGGFGGSTAHAAQHRAGTAQHSGASSVHGPGIQAAQSHAVNSGLY